MKLRQRRDLPRRREVRRRGGQVQHRARTRRCPAPTAAASWRRWPAVDVVDPMTVRLNLSAPFSPLLAQLADRAGMMVSPKAAQAARRQVRHQAGLLRARSSSSSASRRTASCSSASPTTGTRTTIHFDTIVYTPIPDATVRLANLQSGQLDFIERVAPTDMRDAASATSKLKIARITEHRLPGHHDQHRQERPGAAEPARHATRACARPSSCRSTARASPRW